MSEVAVWVKMSQGRGNNGGIPILATMIEPDYEFASGDDQPNPPEVVINRIRKRVADARNIKMGPMPLFPYWAPIEKMADGSSFPNRIDVGKPSKLDAIDPTSLSVSEEFLNDFPVTYMIRPEYYQNIECSFHLGMARPYNDINDQKLDVYGGTDVGINSASPGVWITGYEDFPNGTEHSTWMVHLDGQPMCITIEHRLMNNDGSEDDSLQSYWKPEDIWSNIWKPRIKLNKPIPIFGRYGSYYPSTTQITEKPLGWIYNPRFINAISYMWPTEVFWRSGWVQNNKFWSVTNDKGIRASYSNTFELRGREFELYPGFRVPNIDWMIQWLDQNAGSLGGPAVDDLADWLTYYSIPNMVGSEGVDCFPTTNNFARMTSLMNVVI